VKILVVDADPGAQRLIARMLHAVPNLELFAEGRPSEAAVRALAVQPDLILVDVDLGGMRDAGLEVLRYLRAKGSTAATVVIAASPSFASAREAMRLGAQDYFLRDTLSPELLTSLVEAQRDKVAQDRPRERPRTAATGSRTAGSATLMGSSAAMASVRAIVAQVAPAMSPVLVFGETGTGKELVARMLHDASPRRSEPFVAVNCAALPGALIESLIFGHERGAFTGAETRRRGQLELAGSGTLLLDEIGDMPIELQAKLLRVLQEQRFRPLGSETEVPVRARVVAATHTDLTQLIAAGRFREDLFYRLEVVTITLPPLAKRDDDVLELLSVFARTSGRTLRFSDEALLWIRDRRWPGNVRQLRNFVERLALLAPSDDVDVAVIERLGGALVRSKEEPVTDFERFVDWFFEDPPAFATRLQHAEHVIITRAIERCGGNRTAAARYLGIDRKLLERRLERLALEAPQSLPVRRLPTG
jgi:DNA-binding NtrC family response regulator